jgi:hypothetical protein
VWKRRWGSLLLVALLVAITGGTAVAALAGARRADTAFDRFFDATGEPEVAALLDFDRLGFDIDKAKGSEEELAAAAELPGVEGAAALAVWVLTPGPPLEPWQFGVVRAEGNVNRGRVVRGRAPDPARPDEVALNEAAARGLGVDVGSSLVLHTAAADQAEDWVDDGYVEAFRGPDIPVLVTGIIRGAEDIAQAEDTTVLTTPAFFDRYHDSVLHCVCFAMFNLDDVSSAAAVAPQLHERYARYGFIVEEQEEGQLPEQAADGIDVEVTSLLVLAVVAALAGLLVVGQAMARQLADAGGHDGTRRALGTTTAQLTLSSILVLAPAVVLGAIGAVALAITASPLFPRGLARQAEISAGLRVDAPVLAIGCVAVLLLGLLLTCSIARWSASPRRGVARGLAPLPGWLPPAPRLGVAFAARPGRRGRVAVWSGVIATTVAVAGVLGVWAFEASRAHLLDEPRLFGVDADLGLNAGPLEEPEQELAGIAAMEGTDAVGLRYELDADAEVTSARASVDLAPDATALIEGEIGPTVIAGRLPAGPAEVAIGEAVANELGAAVGDPLVVRIADTPSSLTVVGKIVSWDTDEVDRGFQLTPEGLRHLAATCEDLGCSAEPSAAMVRLASGTAGRDARAELLRTGWVPVPAPSVVDNLGQAGPVPFALGAFLAVLGLAGLVHAVVVTLRRRRRDVAVARSLGLGTAGARSSLRWSSLTVVAVGLLIGIPLGIAAGRFTWGAIAGRLGVLVEHTLPWWAPLGVAALVVAVGLVVSELPARRAGHLRPADVLRTE